MTYNDRSKVLDLGNLIATKYKHNKEIYVPNIEASELESFHETRRVELKRVFNRVQKWWFHFCGERNGQAHGIKNCQRAGPAAEEIA